MSEDKSTKAMADKIKSIVASRTTDTGSSSSKSGQTERNTNVSLFGSSSNLSSPPVLTSTDPTTFNTWKGKFKNYCMMASINKVVFQDTMKSTAEAAAYLASYGVGTELIEMKYKELHSRAFGALAIAIEPAIGQTIINEIENEQQKNPTDFIDQNGYVLWSKLVDRYEKKTAYATLSIFKQLISLNYHRDESPTQFKQKLDTLLLQLNRTEDEVTVFIRRFRLISH